MKNYPTHNLYLNFVLFAKKIWYHYFNGVFVDVIIGQKSRQYVFTKRELNLRQRRWLESLKDYDPSNLYHPGTDNFGDDDLRRFSIGSTAHLEEQKEEQAKEVHRLSCLGVPLIDSTDRRILVTNGVELSLALEVKEKQHKDIILI